MKSLIAEEIKDLVTMEHIYMKYGFKPNRMGFISCPFHKEKTASLKAYKDNKKFKCFGCNENGSVIDFVSKLFNLNFGQTLERINYDFGLNLPVGKRLSLREKAELDRAYKRMQEKAKKQKEEEEKYERLYWKLWGDYILWDNLRIEHKPKNDTEDMHPLFVEALHILPQIEYKIDLLL